MGRYRLVVSAVVAVVLISSLFFVPGSFAEPLGAGLLAQFGVGATGQSDTGGEAAPFIFSLPVTVKNQDDEPVPVTVQGDSGGSLTTEQENLPGSQPFDISVDMSFGTDFLKSYSLDVPVGKIFIVRSASGFITVGPGETLTPVTIISTPVNWPSSMGQTPPPITHYVFPLTSQTLANGYTEFDYNEETWFESAASISSLAINVIRENGNATINPESGEFTLSGYIIDAPETAAP